MQTRNDSEKKYFRLTKWFQLIFSLDYDLQLFETYTDCSETIPHTENRDLKNLFPLNAQPVTSQFMPLKTYMYFLPPNITENMIQKRHRARFLQFDGILALFI